MAWTQAKRKAAARKMVRTKNRLRRERSKAAKKAVRTKRKKYGKNLRRG